MTTITQGVRLGPYEVDSPIGAGGMGEVYRARDTRLDRSVALKILPSEFAANAQFRLRFEREARTISSLNHPHICQLYDVGETSVSDGASAVHYLVMELLQGETLAERLRRGALPLEQAIRVGVEIAAALDNAHRRGVIHRDLKPANVMLTPSGAKLLDFGLAKGTPVYGSAGDVSVSGETHQKALTEEGTILGTFQYMAPEQLEGQEADARTDIFAFGAVLYEMVTGSAAFQGKTRTSLIAAIVDRDPPPISGVQPLTPPALERIIRVCLAKDPDQRWQTAHDLLLQLRWIEEAGSQAGIPAPIAARRRTRERFAWLLHIATAATAVGLTWGALQWQRKPPEVIQLAIVSPKGADFQFGQGPMVISPDGVRLAFLARKDGTTMLWTRALNGATAQPLAGTEGAAYPFWSPDGRYLGFFAGGKLKKIDANGGPAQALCDAAAGRGGTWSPAGVIAFAPDVYSEIHIVADSGGIPRAVTATDESVRSHRLPWFLPDGRHFLYLGENSQGLVAALHKIRLGSIDGSVSRDLIEAQSSAIFADGFLLYVRDRSLVAQRFDPKTFETGRDLTPLGEDLRVYPRYHAPFSASSTGILVYEAGGSAAQSQLHIVDADGKIVQAIGKPGDYRNPAVSHDGNRVAVGTESGQSSDIWIIDLTRGTSTRLTFGAASEFVPIWSSDGESIIYTSNEKSSGDIMRKRSSGTGTEEVLYASKHFAVATSVSADGNLVVFQELNSASRTDWDIWLLRLPEKKAEIFLQTPFNEGGAVISPDSRWLAYTSNETGRSEVYAQALSGGGGKWQISPDGGTRPVWSRDGRKLHYESGGKVMVVEIDGTGDRLQAGVPKELFSLRLKPLAGSQIDAFPDGQRFIANIVTEEARIEPLAVVLNWPERVKKTR